MGKGVVFMTTQIAWSGFNLHLGHFVAPFAKTLYDNYFCLAASSKQQIKWTKIQRNPQEYWMTGNASTDADTSKHETVIAIKSKRPIISDWRSPVTGG